MGFEPIEQDDAAPSGSESVSNPFRDGSVSFNTECHAQCGSGGEQNFGVILDVSKGHERNTAGVLMLDSSNASHRYACFPDPLGACNVHQACTGIQALHQICHGRLSADKTIGLDGQCGWSVVQLGEPSSREQSGGDLVNVD